MKNLSRFILISLFIFNVSSVVNAAVYTPNWTFIDSLSGNGSLMIDDSGYSYCVQNISSSYPYNWGSQLINPLQGIPSLNATITTVDLSQCSDGTQAVNSFTFYYQPKGASGFFYLDTIWVYINADGSMYSQDATRTPWLHTTVKIANKHSATVILTGVPPDLH